MRTALIVRKSCPAIGRLTEKRRPAPGKRAGLVLSFAGMFEPPRGLAVPVISEAVFASGKSARASAYGGIASIVSIRGEASAEPVTQGTKKRLRLRRAAICFCQSLRISAVLFHFLEIDVGHIIGRRPPAIGPPPAPVPLAPAPDWAPAFGPCWAFCWALYISCEAACHALLSSVVALSMSARF